MKNNICLILVIIVITCNMSQAQSWTTSGDTISTTGTIKGASLNITGSCVKFPGILTDTNTDLLGINKLGKVSPLIGPTLSAALYPTAPPFILTCDTTNPLWYKQSIFGNSALVTRYCTVVGVGEAGISNFPDAPLSISNSGWNIQFSVVNPTSLTDMFTIDKSGNTNISGNTVISGLAGIGTATSSLRLNVAGKSGQYATLITTADTSNTYNIISQFSTTNSAGKIGLAVHIAAGSSNYDVFDVYGNGNGYYAGNVLIQTTNNEYALNVGGIIWSHEVEVCMSGCDFVFDKDYKLMPLNDLKNYLELNHHLPGIASAKEMESSNGVALGKMNSQLLQKVEELTLYLLKQQKQLEEQNEKIKDLQNVVSSLQKK